MKGAHHRSQPSPVRVHGRILFFSPEAQLWRLTLLMHFEFLGPFERDLHAFALVSRFHLQSSPSREAHHRHASPTALLRLRWDTGRSISISPSSASACWARDPPLWIRFWYHALGWSVSFRFHRFVLVHLMKCTGHGCRGDGCHLTRRWIWPPEEDREEPHVKGVEKLSCCFGASCWFLVV